MTKKKTPAKPAAPAAPAAPKAAPRQRARVATVQPDEPVAPKARARVAAPAAPPAESMAALAESMSGPSPERSALMPEQDAALHSGLHDMHESAQRFDASLHDEDDFPENWAPPSELEAPAPRPGMVQRWVRLSMKGQPDGNNLSAQGKSGWRPRTLESVPEGDRKNYPTIKDPRSTGMVIVNKDLILCEMPKRLYDQMTEYYARKRKSQVNALVDQNLAGSAIKGADRHGFGAPHVAERRSSVTIDRVPIVAAD